MILLTDQNRTPIKGEGKKVSLELKRHGFTLMQFCRDNWLMDYYVQLSRWLNGTPNVLNSYRFIEKLKETNIINGFKIVNGKGE